MKQKSKLKKYPQNPIKNQLGEKENRKKRVTQKNWQKESGVNLVTGKVG